MRMGRISARKRWLLGVLVIALPVVAALLWKPLMLEFRSARARWALAARENQQAVEELEAALRLAPDRPETLFLLARAHRRLGNLDRVHNLLQRADRLGGDRERGQREMWLLLARAGRLQDAESRLEALLADPHDDGPDIWDSFVQGYLANLLVGPTERLLDAWQKEYPEDPQQYFMRAALSQHMGRPREAAEAYRRGLSLAPGDAAMRYRLALVLMASSEFDEAGEELRRCAEHDPENPEVLAALAECHRKRGEVDRAGDMLRQLLHRPTAAWLACLASAMIANAQSPIRLRNVIVRKRPVAILDSGIVVVHGALPLASVVTESGADQVVAKQASVFYPAVTVARAKEPSGASGHAAAIRDSVVAAAGPRHVWRLRQRFAIPRLSRAVLARRRAPLQVPA